MRSNFISTAAFMASVAIANPIILPRATSTCVFSTGATPACTSGAVVFAVRGSDFSHTTLAVDPAYTSLPTGMSSVANAVCSKAGGGSLNPIPYPAIDPSYDNYDDYDPSVDDGVKALQSAISSYVAKCTAGSIFVLGHSQGAQVASGALAGTKDIAPLKSTLVARRKYFSLLSDHTLFTLTGLQVTGAAITADPSYWDDETKIDYGSGANDGLDGTAANQTKYNFLEKNFPTKLRSYCQAGDEYCDSGTASNASNIHNNAPAYFAADEIAWLTSLI